MTDLNKVLYLSPEGIEVVRHNYHRKLRRLMDEGRINPTPEMINSLQIAHDNWCGIFMGLRCDCDPDFRLNGRSI